MVEIEGKLPQFEQECQTIKQTQTELLELLQQCNKTTFSLKREGFEVGLLTKFYNHHALHIILYHSLKNANRKLLV